MSPDDPLLQILACPLDKGPLHLVRHEEAKNGLEAPEGDRPDPSETSESLYNPRLHRRYPIVDGIPQLLPSSGEQVTEDEHEELLKRMSS
ncbi:Trm112 family protein [Streptomyces ipomoeae]|uniref:Trm112 family protein n=1 Tax=Streptomyces ipomoeae TaxID=103232 RepID=A0AAE8W310_9ACTN|nr:Trm112 family protein [Streptomyces ipomoeae]TQE31625.1 Trm112 family protein [Streptomyces ipomoeae]